MIPKFRAWDKVLKKMFEVSFIDFDTKLIGLNIDLEIIIFDFDDVILMQSTGLFDSSTLPKEIFESDNLKCTSTDGSFWYETVSWDSTLAGFATQQNGYDATAISYITDSEAITVEVIGNIHENPELLEQPLCN